MTDERTQLLKEAIKHHLESHGPRDWNILQGRFPEISHATFWRHVKAVRATPSPVEEKPGATAEPNHNFGDGLFPPFFNTLKKLAEHERLLFEAEEMGRQAKNSQGKNTNWRMHAKSVEMRRSILVEQVELAERLVELGKIDRLYDSVVEVVQGASPEVAKEIILRMRRFQEVAADGI